MFVCVCVCVCVFVVALLSISKSKPDKNNKCFCLYHFAWCGLFNLIVLTAGHMQTVVPPLPYTHALSLSLTHSLLPSKCFERNSMAKFNNINSAALLTVLYSLSGIGSALRAINMFAIRVLFFLLFVVVAVAAHGVDKDKQRILY